MDRHRAASERGIAIVAALWAAAMFAIVTLSVSQIVRANAGMAHGRAQVAALDAVADAAINITILSMLGPRPAQPPLNATAFTVPFEGHAARVRVRDEAGLIDLNLAPLPVLQQLLLGAGLDPGAAAAVTERILDWRGSGGPHSGGASGAGGHRQRFQSVTELLRVDGVTPALYRRVAPLLTVYSQTAGISPAFADLAVLNVYRPLDPAAEAAWRRLEEEQAGLRAPDPSPGVAVGHAFTITAEVAGADAARVVRTATIRLTGRPDDPLLVYRWE
ncbi:type II secretion system protein GspK [Acidisphaera rubrifaciens]|uniref:General secretion pathway protein K n=1 Tax=Acidisphaera rubrifaciens HS-AP3 TaxID=1231350 RepID=A0A0D6PBW2_9PROT|nr:type II secretion system protein GspK [Acidisphaera rubrifaciens]GAN78354.1 general secretion pathway protein K [Acidisphaera rubrifaciens HS-AP3]